MIYDPNTYYWNRSNRKYRRAFMEHPRGGWMIKTNEQGFRKTADVLAQSPDLRILFAGDSHTGGVVPEHENMVQVLEALMLSSLDGQTVEALNAGHGGYDYWHYLGTLERTIQLKPDVFVVVGFGGNDFSGAARLYRYHNSNLSNNFKRRFPTDAYTEIRELRDAILSQDLMQVLHFVESKQLVAYAERATCQVMTEIKRLCDEAGIRLIYVHIPPSMDAQPQILGDSLQAILKVCPMTPEELQVTDRLTDRVMSYLDELGVETVDMRPTYKASVEDCYWRSDFHINTLGHRLIAEALAERLAAN